MKTIKVPAQDVVRGDVVRQPGTKVHHIVLANVNHPSGRVLLGGYPGNEYVIGRVGEVVEVYRR